MQLHAFLRLFRDSPAGRAIAEIAAMAAEYDWHRDPNQLGFAARSEREESDDE